MRNGCHGKLVFMDRLRSYAGIALAAVLGVVVLVFRMMPPDYEPSYAAMAAHVDDAIRKANDPNLQTRSVATLLSEELLDTPRSSVENFSIDHDTRVIAVEDRPDSKGGMERHILVDLRYTVSISRYRRRSGTSPMQSLHREVVTPVHPKMPAAREEMCGPASFERCPSRRKKKG